MNTEKELVVAYLSKTLNMDETGVASLIYNEDGTSIKQDALTALVSKQSEIVQRIKSESSLKFNDGHKAGTREAMQKFENEIKQKFGINDDLKGVELVEKIVQSKTVDTGKEITEDDIKKHPVYRSLADKLTATERESEKKLNTEIDKLKSEWKRSETMKTIGDHAADWLVGKKAVLSKDATRARNQMRLLLDELNSYDFDIQDAGDKKRFLPLKDGKVLEDNLGHAISFETLLSSIAEKYYDFEKSDGRSSPPPPNGAAHGTQGGNGITLRKPVSEKEWFDQHEAIEKNQSLKPDEKVKMQIELKNLYKNQTADA